jgi:trimeric autotransporter adhesin
MSRPSLPGFFSRALACGALVLLAAPVHADTFTVTSTANAGAGTFRQALLDANTNPGDDDVEFDIAGCPGSPPVCTIAPTSPLPIVTGRVFINGYLNGMGTPNTNPTSAGLNTVLGVEIDLTNNAGCLDFRGGGGLRGVVVNRSPTVAVCVQGSPAFEIDGCFIGTNATGTAALGNDTGILLISDSNLVGGNTPAARNLISGNTTGVQIGTGIAQAPPNTARDNLVAGNLIGTNAAGTAALPGQSTGIVVQMDSSSFSGHSSLIGGPGPQFRNVVSGQAQDGVLLSGGSLLGPGQNIVMGNYIGTDVTGTVAIPNNTGVGIIGFNGGNTVGSTTAANGNLISGNTVSGVAIGTPDNVVRFNRIGTDAGTGALPNGTGIQIDVADDSIVTTNTIAFNGNAGVLIGVADDTTVGNTIDENSIHTNGARGIDLTGAANNAQSAPAITAASIAGPTLTVSGTLTSDPGASFLVQIFSNAACDASGFGEGQTFLGETTVNTNGAGSGSFGPLALMIPGGQPVITATATANTNGSTSEFGACFTAAGGGPVNTPPVAVADAYSTNEGVQLVVGAPGVLGNDTDADLEPLTAVLNVGPTNGALALNPNGSFTYAPNPGFSGSDSFTYHANDGAADSNVVTVSIDVVDVAGAQPIPTLQGWALLLLAAALAAGGAIALRRPTQASR